MDRQDIDALLIGALYGELTPADEARLATHLDSHPGDRGALDDLKVARQAIAESRIFAVHLDPPQHVSALLLQEAHRRAPKRAVVAEEKESWFYRFTRSFLAHPAMAAAAMLVLVLGGAGIMYMKKGDQFASQEVSSVSRDRDLAPNEAPAVAAGSGSAINAGLYEGAAGTASISTDPAKDNGADKAEESASDRWEGQQATGAQHNGFANDRAKLEKAAPSRGITVGTNKGTVKELERAKGAKNDDSLDLDLAGDSARAPGAASGGGGRAGTATGATNGVTTGAMRDRADGNEQQIYAQPPPPPSAAPAPNRSASAPTATTTPPRAPAPTADAKKAPAKVATSSATTKAAPEKPADAPAMKQEAKPDSSLIAWAKGEHARAVALAQKGECAAAAKLALGVSSRASDYYAQYMATDRALKQCAQYINAERDKDAERSAKSRAQKRTNADESPAPAPTTTK